MRNYKEAAASNQSDFRFRKKTITKPKIKRNKSNDKGLFITNNSESLKIMKTKQLIHYEGCHFVQEYDIYLNDCIY